MADMFVFSSPRDAKLEAIYARSSAKRRCVDGRKRTKACSKMDGTHEHACMAHIAEPVFCQPSSVLPFLPSASTGYTLPAAVGSEDHHESSVTTDEHDWTEAQATPTGLPLRIRHPRPESDEIAIEEESRRLRLALPGEVSDSIPLFAIPPGPVSLSRLSQRCSCESLRSHLSQPGATFSGNDAAGHDDSLYDLEDLDEAYDYTILDDMVPSAWSVDDYRHARDVSDFADELSAAEGGALARSQLRIALDRRDDSHVTRRRNVVDGRDMQGLRWDTALVPEARDDTLSMRAFMHPSRHGRAWSDAEFDRLGNLNARTERFYRFQHLNGRGAVRPTFGHYELRHMLASNGRRAYYANNSKIYQTDLAVPTEGKVALDLTRSTITSSPIKVTSLATTSNNANNMLIVGGFEGEYAMMNLDLPNSHTEGLITLNRKGLVTHIHTFTHRTSGHAQAAFCSNDNHFRIMDIGTQQFTHNSHYDASINCAATSPDGRLRVLAGDSPDALMTDAATGEKLVTLRGHTDDIFACAWSPDHRLVATGSADRTVLLWDPRNWSQPLAAHPSVVTCARSLHFSADSALLVAAESEDVVSVFDTRTLGERQDIWFFGTIAGVALLNGGEELVIGNGDRTLGGLMTFERTRGARYGVRGGEVAGGPGRRRRRVRDVVCPRNELVRELIM